MNYGALIYPRKSFRAVSDVTFELTAFRLVSQESGMGVSAVLVSIVSPRLHFS